MFSDFFEGLGDLFSVSSPVTPDTDLFSTDAIKTDAALDHLGYQGMGTLDTKIRSFQTDVGETVDGVLNPGGPTETALNQNLASQGLSTADPLEKKEPPLPPHVTVEPNGDTGFTASASFGPKKQKPKPLVTPSLETTTAAKPKPPSISKIDPITGLADPLAQSSGLPKKSKAEMDKLWEQSKKMQEGEMSRSISTKLMDEELNIKNHIADFEDTTNGERGQQRGEDIEEGEENQETQSVKHPPVIRHITSGSTRLKLNNTLNIRVQSYTLLADGVDIGIFFGSLDKDGNMHSLAPERIINFAFPHVGSKEEIIDFGVTPYGWEVVVRVLPSESKSGNSGGFDVQVQGS